MSIVQNPKPATHAPPGWGRDELSKYLQRTHEQQYASFHNKRAAMAKLVAIDALFVRVSDRWLNPASGIVAMLFLRTHSSLRVAIQEAMAGQAVESYRQARGVLENAGYAVHVHRDPALGEVWLNRHADKATRAASKKAFNHPVVAASVAAANLHAGARFDELYERAIDLGGHPNERSVTGNMKLIEEPDKKTMLAIILHGDGPALDASLKNAAQCGMVALEVFETIYSAKFQILGISADMLELRKGL